MALTAIWNFSSACLPKPLAMLPTSMPTTGQPTFWRSWRKSVVAAAHSALHAIQARTSARLQVALLVARNHQRQLGLGPIDEDRAVHLDRIERHAAVLVRPRARLGRLRRYAPSAPAFFLDGGRDGRRRRGRLCGSGLVGFDLDDQFRLLRGLRRRENRRRRPLGRQVDGIGWRGGLRQGLRPAGHRGCAGIAKRIVPGLCLVVLPIRPIRPMGYRPASWLPPPDCRRPARGTNST